MMQTLCLAASLAAAIVVPQTKGVGQRELDEDVLWARMRPAVATLNSTNGPTGVAVLIDTRGWFLAHGAAVGDLVSQPGAVEGKPFTFQLLSKDKETNLVLLQAVGWRSDVLAVRVSTAASQTGERILAATVDGPVWAELGRKDRVGNMMPSQRYAPLNELRLESGKARVQGALAFNERGELVGVLGATLGDPELKSGGQARGGGQGSGGTSNFGPSEPTVAYAFGPKLLQRVVEGFRAPDHVVRHPSIGIFFKKSPDGGALIDSVVEGGEAQKSGLMAGDVVIEADGAPVHEAVSFATILFNQAIGDNLVVKVRRGKEVKSFTVRVGAQALEMMASSSFQRTDRSPLNSLNSGLNATSNEVPTWKF